MGLRAEAVPEHGDVPVRKLLYLILANSSNPKMPKMASVTKLKPSLAFGGATPVVLAARCQAMACRSVSGMGLGVPVWRSIHTWCVRARARRAPSPRRAMNVWRMTDVVPGSDAQV